MNLEITIEPQESKQIDSWTGFNEKGYRNKIFAYKTCDKYFSGPIVQKKGSWAFGIIQKQGPYSWPSAADPKNLEKGYNLSRFIKSNATGSNTALTSSRLQNAEFSIRRPTIEELSYLQQACLLKEIKLENHNDRDVVLKLIEKQFPKKEKAPPKIDLDKSLIKRTLSWLSDKRIANGAYLRKFTPEQRKNFKNEQLKLLKLLRKERERQQFCKLKKSQSVY